MAKKGKINEFAHLPAAAAHYIKLVVKKIGYRRCIRKDVKKELIAHFEDALKDCNDSHQAQLLAQTLIETFGKPKILAKLIRKAKKRCRPLWRTIFARTFQAIAIFILLIIAYCILITFAKPLITTDYLKKINNLSRPAADESLNAAHDYRKAFEAYKEPDFWYQEVKNIKDFNESELSRIKLWIADNNIAIDYFLKASEKPYCWWDRKLEDPNKSILMDILLTEPTGIKRLAAWIMYDAEINAHDGNIDKALDEILSCYKSATHLKGNHMLVEQLVGMWAQSYSIDTLLHILKDEKVASDKLKRLQTRLANIAEMDYRKIYFETERLCTLDKIQKSFTDEIILGGRLLPNYELYDTVFNMFLLGTSSFDSSEKHIKTHKEIFEEKVRLLKENIFLYKYALLSASKTEIIRFVNESYDEYDKLCLLTPSQGREKLNLLERKLNITGIKGYRYLVPLMLMPPIRKVIEIGYRNNISNDAAICIIALHRYKLDKGAYPDTIEQLQQAGYIKYIPMDPFSDKQIVYKKTDDDFILYSVGLDFTDNGGRVFNDKEGKPMRVWSDNSGDAVFWPVEQPPAEQSRKPKLFNK